MKAAILDPQKPKAYEKVVAEVMMTEPFDYI
jgi:hypothetical protein